MDSSQIWAFHRRYFFLFLDSEKNIVSSSRKFCLKFGTGELSGTIYMKFTKSGFWRVLPEPELHGRFGPENPGNERFRSVSDQQKKLEQKILSGSGEIFVRNRRSVSENWKGDASSWSSYLWDSTRSTGLQIRIPTVILAQEYHHSSEWERATASWVKTGGSERSPPS